MKDGWIQQVGEPLELYGKPENRFVAGFIGSPAMNFVDVGLQGADGGLTAQATGLRLGIPPAAAGRLASYKGQHVTLGVRPEDLHIAGGGDPAQYVFDAVVDVVEPLGAEILLDVKVGPISLVARVEPTVRLKVRDPVRLALNPERLYFFDMTSEKAI
jgi:multiple sugar transport system ATP-binding protein